MSWKNLSKNWKKHLHFLKISTILKSVDEHPHKQVKNYKIKDKNVANTNGGEVPQINI